MENFGATIDLRYTGFQEITDCDILDGQCTLLEKVYLSQYLVLLRCLKTLFSANKCKGNAKEENLLTRETDLVFDETWC